MGAGVEAGTSRRDRPGSGEVDRLVSAILLARAVDPGQVPMYQPARIDSPEMNLLRAVLADALRSVLRPRTLSTTAQSRELAEDLAWFESDDDGHAFAFVVICQRLCMEPEWIRRLIRVHRSGRPPLQAEAA
jgi:hypothetical protein